MLYFLQILFYLCRAFPPIVMTLPGNVFSQLLQQLLLHIFKANSLNSLRKTFSLYSIVTEEKNGLFNYIQGFFFGCKNPAKGFSLRYFFTPASTYVYLIAVSAVLNGMERTLDVYKRQVYKSTADIKSIFFPSATQVNSMLFFMHTSLFWDSKVSRTLLPVSTWES